MRHVGRGDGLDALMEQPLRRQRPIGHGACQHDLSQRVQPRHVRRGVGLRVAEALRVPKHVRVIEVQALHEIQHVVGGAVQDAAHRADLIALTGKGEIVQKRYAAAAGRAEEEGHAPLPRDRVELGSLCRHQRLVAGDKVLARPECRRGVGIGRLHAAHDLRHRAHRGVVHDLVNACHLEIGVLLPRAHQHRPRLQPFGLFQHLVHAETDGSESQYRNFHAVTFFLKKFYMSV